MSSSRTELYKKLLRQVAKELDEKPSAEIVKHVATLRLMRKNLQIRLLTGERIDPGDIVKLDEALRHYLPAGKPIKVDINIVPSVGPAPDTPSPSSPPPDPSPPSTPPPTETGPPAPSAAPASNVVPLRKPGGSINDPCPVTGQMPPLKRLQGDDSWRGHVLPNIGGSYSGGNPFGAGPAPDWSACHPLPSPYERS